MVLHAIQLPVESIRFEFPPASIPAVTYYQPGEEVYGQGERAACLYRIEFGTIRVYRLLADGRRQISAFHLAGEVFGFSADGTHHFFADAIGPAGIRALRPTGADGQSRDLLSLALESLVRAQEHLLVLGRQSATERVAAFLVEMCERQGEFGSIDLPMSRTDIGDYLGLTIETVSRVFSKLRAARIIRLNSLRNIAIIRLDTLKAMCE
jgi:CRP/FNR family transcriptional regulator, nitrogen fixation regulation protein